MMYILLLLLFLYKTEQVATQCPTGYYQQSDGCSKCYYYCYTCNDGSTCQTCASSECTLCTTTCASSSSCLVTNCSNCIAGYYLHSNGSCYRCNNTGCACTIWNNCPECLQGKYGSKCQHSCPDGCKNQLCSKTDGRCTDGCISGTYGLKCQYTCSGLCTSNVCEQDSGVCIADCADGYYSFLGVCYECPNKERCVKCESSTKCTECISGKYGDTCQFNCQSGCKDNICELDSGICSLGSCENGFYLDESKGLCNQCRSYCSSCSGNFICSTCTSAQYWGSYCQHRCDNCASGCNKGNGCSISCQTGYYRSYDRSKRGFVCMSCPVRCLSCTTDTYCVSCKHGYYVYNNNCKSCNANCKVGNSPVCNSTTGSCTYGCKPGFVGERCDTSCDISNCQSCSAEDTSVCNLCKEGFYLETITSCSNCPAYCKSGPKCDAYNGNCVDGCSDSWSGQQCNQPCPKGCQRCDQFNSSSCSVCNIGFYGDVCKENCSSQCHYQDNLQVCNQNNGHCNFGCNEGFWDNKCQSLCGTGCNGSLCNMTTGVCIYGCINGYFGEECNAECSIYCMETQIGRICKESNGNCLKGCTPGWFGETCTVKCSDQCNGTVCNRNNGTCTFGCIDGYTGPKCKQALVSANEGSTNVKAIGAGAGVGVALLLAVVVIVGVFLWRRRRMSSKLDDNDRGMDHISPDYQKADPDLEYSNVGDTGTLGKEDIGNTGLSNQVYANVCITHISKEEEPNTVVDTAKPVSEDYFKEEEVINGEFEAKEFETDAGIVDSTYYNVAGKRVTVANLPEYIKSKRLGDIYADFQRIPKGLLKDYKEAKKANNAHKNKYRLIYPYDESRIILHDGGSDYMNASYIEGYNKKKEYIASSGPFAKTYDTTPDFWRMIWQEKCDNIVMLTNPVENGDTKCVKYWPEPDASTRFGNLHVTCLTEDQYADFTIRIFTLTQGDESFNVRHLHFTAWPDKGVPLDVTSMIEFRQKVRGLHKDKDCPLLVHCSAGIGRTGTFIALDMLTFEGEDRGSVDIFGCVAALRSQRCNMVQTKEQYDYLHRAVLHALTFDCRSIAGDMFLQNYNKLIEKNGGKRIIDKQFKQLQSTTEEMTDEDQAEVVRNQSLTNKNRKGADIPVDEYRVKLYENRKPGAVDYINAVRINGFRTRQKFIVAQTPLPSTVVDFLTLVHQEKCSCIVMMEEADIQNKAVGVYWPADNQSIKHGVFKISCKDSTSTQHYTKKTLSIMCHGLKGEDIQDVHLFIFTEWPKENAIPITSDSVLQLVKAVDTVNRSKDEESTILVHCMTGSERSCVYCAVSLLTEKMEIEHEVSVVNTLRQLKARRRSAFPSLDQYKFCHQAVISYLQSFDIYSNFGLKESVASPI